MSTTTSAILKLQNYPSATPACIVIWLSDDVISRAHDLNVGISKELAAEILESLEQNHDCNYGITWDHIDAELDNHKEHEGYTILKEGLK